MTSPNGTSILVSNPVGTITDSTGALWTARINQGSPYLFPVRNGVQSPAYPDKFGYGTELRSCNGDVYILNGAWAGKLTVGGFVHVGSDAPCPASTTPVPPSTTGKTMVTAEITGDIASVIKPSDHLFNIVQGVHEGFIRIYTVNRESGNVTPRPPHIDWQETVVGLKVSVTDQGSGPNIVSAQMKWGDGSALSTNNGPIVDTAVIFEHTYAAAGRYAMEYFVTDSNGVSNKFLRMVDVGTVVPPPAPPLPVPPVVPQPVPTPNNPLGLTSREGVVNV